MSKAGRKPIPLDLKQVEAFAGLGLTEKQICECLGIGIETLRRRRNGSKDFAEALKKGKALGIAHVTNKLLANINDQKEASIMFWLKCNAGWKETQILEHSGKVTLILGGDEIDPEKLGW
jgi:hypothetical protein